MNRSDRTTGKGTPHPREGIGIELGRRQIAEIRMQPLGVKDLPDEPSRLACVEGMGAPLISCTSCFIGSHRLHNVNEE